MSRLGIIAAQTIPRPDKQAGGTGKHPRAGDKRDTKGEVVAVLDGVLSLKGRASEFTLSTPLLGAIPELDSMAVVALITTCLLYTSRCV